MLKLKTTILPSEDPPDEAKNEECYAELIQFLDDKSLSLVMRDAADDGRKEGSKDLTRALCKPK